MADYSPKVGKGISTGLTRMEIHDAVGRDEFHRDVSVVMAPLRAAGPRRGRRTPPVSTHVTRDAGYSAPLFLT